MDALQLNRFVPIALRVIRSEKEVLETIRLGFATDRISPELRHFLDFLDSEPGRSTLREVRFVEPLERCHKPKAVHTASYKPYKMGIAVNLVEPILTY